MIIVFLFSSGKKESSYSSDSYRNIPKRSYYNKPQIIREFKFREFCFYRDKTLIEEVKVTQSVSECQNMFILTGYINMPLLILHRSLDQNYYVYTCEDHDRNIYSVAIHTHKNTIMFGRRDIDETYILR